MSAETQKVLEMVAEGKLTPADADRLLDKLSHSAQNEAPPQQTPPATAGTRRYLCIVVDKPGRDPLNVRIPLSFLRSGMAWAVMPEVVRERLAERGLDPGKFLNLRKLGSMNAAELDAVLEQLNMEIEKGDGKKVRIFAE